MVAILIALLVLAAFPAGAHAACAGVAVTPDDDLAAAVAASDRGATFCLAAGTYRTPEPIVLRRDQTLSAAAPGEVTITGARRLVGWTEAAPGVWRIAVPGLVPTRNRAAAGHRLLEPEERYKQDVLYDGAFLEKVGVRLESGALIGAPRSTLGPGEAFVNYAQDTVSIGSPTRAHVVELTWVDNIVDSRAAGVTVSGVRVYGAANAGVRLRGAGAVVSDVEVLLSANRGVQVNGDRARVRDSRIHHNGVLGLGSNGAQDAAFTRLLVAYNDQKDLRTSARTCSVNGGSKFVATTGVAVTDSHFHHNGCNAIWFDLRNVGALIAGNRVHDNRHGAGISYEASYDGRILDNVVAANGRGGIHVRASRDVEVAGNVVTRNLAEDARSGDVLLFGVDRPGGPPALGAHRLRDVHVHHNTITSVTKVGIISKDDPRPDLLFDPTVNRFTANDYVLASCAAAAVFQWDGTRTWPGWRGIGNDADAEASCRRLPS